MIDTAELYLYKATQAIDLKMNGLKTEPKEVWKSPSLGWGAATQYDLAASR